MTAEFVPTIFRELGKPVKDLLERKYKYEKNFKARTRTADGLTITGEHIQKPDCKGKDAKEEAGVKAASKVTGRYEDYKNFGAFELSLDTNSTWKDTLKLTTLTKGLTVKATCEQEDKKKDARNLVGTAYVDYKQANVAVTLQAQSIKNTLIVDDKDGKAKTHFIGAAVVAGFDGASVGAEFVRNVTAESNAADFGAQYAAKDYEVTLKTADNTNKASLYALHKYSSAISVAAQLDFCLAAAKSAAAEGDKKEDKKELLSGVKVGISDKYDADTTLQALFSHGGCKEKTNTVGLVAERNLSSNSKISIVSEFGYSNGALQHNKFGIGLVLGELNLLEL